MSGRLGDPKESRQQDEFKSRSGFFQNAHVGGVFVAGTSFSNVNRQIVVETVVNAYCSCSSVGEFNEERGIAIRNNEIDEIKKPTAYVTYKLSALRDALACRIREREGLDNLTLLGRKVIYGEKDRLWDVEESFVYQKQRDAIALWLGTTFIKSRKFTHEEEFRLIAIDLARAGGLPEDSEAIVIEEDAAIAASIVAHSYY